jgi:predicted membrane protein
MSNLTSSIVKGFGFTVGRRAANSVLNSAAQSSNGPVHHSWFTVISGTVLLGGLFGFIIGVILNAFIGTFGFILGVSLGMFLMYRYYTSANKKYVALVQQRNENIKKIDAIVEDIKNQYVANQITKREYEILMSDAKKLYNKV